MKTLSKEYVEEHMSTIHNFDSFGRNLSHAILEATLDKIQQVSEDEESIEIPVKFTVATYGPASCMVIQVEIPTVSGMRWSIIHVAGVKAPVYRTHN